MNPPERYAPDDPREWMNRARSNLVRARSRIPGAYLEDMCFDAQQAAEKAIKAVMIARNIDFPYVHDLASLLSLRDPFDAKKSLSPKTRETVQDETKQDEGRVKDRKWFEETMARAFAERRRVLRGLSRLRPQDHRGLGGTPFRHDPGRLDNCRLLAHRH